MKNRLYEDIKKSISLGYRFFNFLSSLLLKNILFGSGTKINS